MASSSSDSESDSEELKRMKEAAVEVKPTKTVSHITETKKNNQAKDKAKVPDKLSQRYKDIGQDDDSELQVTPEFRSHVAKKLTTFLDSSFKVFESRNHEQSEETQDSDLDSGFRLFSSSLPGYEKRVKPTVKRRPDTSSDSSSEDERCRSIAVSGEYILSKSKEAIEKSTDENNSQKTSTTSVDNSDTSNNTDSLVTGNGTDEKHKRKKAKRHKKKKKQDIDVS